MLFGSVKTLLEELLGSRRIDLTLKQIIQRLPQVILMQLRKGITGFCNVDDPPLTKCNLATFRALCYDAVRMVGGRILNHDRRPNEIEASFQMIVLELRGVQRAVLINNHFPIIGFAVPPNDGDTGPLQFIDCDELGNLFRASGQYEVVSQEELERAVGQNDLEQLLPEEIEQVVYWQPRRVGDVIFNFWD